MDKEKRLTALIKQWISIFGNTKSYKAIRLNCISCCAGHKKAPAKCENYECPLFPWKTGHSELSRKERSYHRGGGGKFVHTVDTVAKTKLEQITGISEAVIVPKKKWDEIQEKLKEKLN
ncbi:hypothetical protein KAU34_10620 [candidate division WOR-3 bacterium]|nr:hypothetical protein [candidate division WOR-3 bacterium]